MSRASSTSSPKGCDSIPHSGLADSGLECRCSRTRSQHEGRRGLPLRARRRSVGRHCPVRSPPRGSVACPRPARLRRLL
jgi:hypothetical protein